MVRGYALIERGGTFGVPRKAPHIADCGRWPVPRSTMPRATRRFPAFRLVGEGGGPRLIRSHARPSWKQNRRLSGVLQRQGGPGARVVEEAGRNSVQIRIEYCQPRRPSARRSSIHSPSREVCTFRGCFSWDSTAAFGGQFLPPSVLKKRDTGQSCTTRQGDWARFVSVPISFLDQRKKPRPQPALRKDRLLPWR